MGQQTREREETPSPEEVRGRLEWLDTRMDGVRLKSWILIGVVIAAVVIGFGAWWVYGLGRGMGVAGQPAAMDVSSVPRFPPVVGFYEGQQVAFAHTEVSDPAVADMLTDMMGSPVLVVPELADVPQSALGTVYVFANGVKVGGARGPFGFQPDVFDSAPGDPDYTPLREVVVIRWTEGGEPRVLRSAPEVEEALAAGEISAEETGVVVNMPFLAWPEGTR